MVRVYVSTTSQDKFPLRKCTELPKYIETTPFWHREEVEMWAVLEVNVP